MKPADNLEESIRKLRRTTGDEMDKRILDDALAALGKHPEAAPPAAKSPVIKFAAAAVVIIAALIAVKVFIGLGEKPPRPIARRDVPATESVVETTKQPAPDVDVGLDTKQTEKILEAEMKDIEKMFAVGDVNGLVAMLEQGGFISKMFAAKYLGQIGDQRALPALEKLDLAAKKDLPKDFGQNFFAEAIAKIKTRLEQQKQKTVLVEAGEGRLEQIAEPNEKDRQQYIYGWLIDANSDSVHGEIQLGGSKAITAEDGAFVIRQPTYREFGSVFGRAFDKNRNLGCFFIWDKNNDTNDVEITVKPLASVSGFVVDSDANPVNDFTLKISVFMKNGAVYKSSIGEEPWKAKVFPDGSFDINSIPTGVPLQLAVKKPGFKTPIKLDNLAPGQNSDLGQITIESLPGFNEDIQWICSLSGFVIDENNEPMVRAVISATVAEERFKTATDSDGWYEFKGLPNNVQIEIIPYSDGYGHNPFPFNCSDPNNRLDIKMFPPAHDWYDEPAPGLFVQKWLNTEPMTLEELTGNVVLLYIGMDSAKDLRFIQEIKNIYDKYKDAPLTVIVIYKHLDHLSDENRLRQFIEENDIEFPFAIDDEMDIVEGMMLPRNRFRGEDRVSVPRRGLKRGGAMCSLYEVKARPAYYLIDKNGILRVSPAQSDLEGWIEQLLAE